jgi:hypothetical protein
MVPSLNGHRCTKISPYSEVIPTGGNGPADKKDPLGRSIRRPGGRLSFGPALNRFDKRHSADEYGRPNAGTGFSLGIKVHSSYEFRSLPSLKRIHQLCRLRPGENGLFETDSRQDSRRLPPSTAFPGCRVRGSGFFPLQFFRV